MKLYETAAAYHTWNCVLMETNRTTTLLSCCDPSEISASLPSDSPSLEPLWVSLSAHSHSSVDGCFSSLSRGGHNLSSSRKTPHKQLNTSPEQPAAPRVHGSLLCSSADAGGPAGAGRCWHCTPAHSPEPCCTGHLRRQQHGACHALAAALGNCGMSQASIAFLCKIKSNRAQGNSRGNTLSKGLKTDLPATSRQRGRCSKSPRMPFVIIPSSDKQPL